MIKSLDAPYEVSGKKVNTWLKLKNLALTSDMRDTLDLVPIGAFYGRGNRTGMYGSFLMASYNSSSQKFETVCKLGTGFTLKQLAEIELEPLATTPQDQLLTANQIYRYSKLIQPDVWLKPSQIWEVQAACFTLSKTYQCGNAIISQQGGAYNGLSLRFPRFIRVRDDKKIRMPLLSFFDMA